MTRPDSAHYSFEEISAWVRRELPENEVSALELHLSGCNDCTFRAQTVYDLSAESGRSAAATHAAARTAELAREGIMTIVSRLPPEERVSLLNRLYSRFDYLSRMLRITAGEAQFVPGLGGEPIPAAVFRGSRPGGDVLKLARLIDRGVIAFAAEVFGVGEKVVVRFHEPGIEEPAPRVLLLEMNDPTTSMEAPVHWDEHLHMWVAVVENPSRDYCIAVVLN